MAAHSKMAPQNPTRRDYLECIKKCHPDAKVMNKDYYLKAKICLHHILPSSSTTTDMNFAYTSRRFVDDVRARWKGKCRSFRDIKKLNWFDENLELLTAPPPKPRTPALPVPQKPPTTRSLKDFDELGSRQQNRVTAKLAEEYEPSAIVKAAEQYFRRIGCNDAAYVLKNMQKEPEKVGGNLRKSLEDPIEKLPQVSRPKCLAYILDRGMTRVDWEETCKLVNEPGHLRIPCYNTLSGQKQMTRPKGRHFSYFYQT